MNIDRRTLLIGGGVGVGLIVGFALWPHGLPSELSTGPHEQTFGNYIKIARDGRVTLAVPQVETGQGIWTALPQIVVDELGAAWESVGVEPAPLRAAYANPIAKEEKWPKGIRITACSTSIRGFEEPLREAAATARMMLVGAAADRWSVKPEQCEVGDGFVINSGRTFTFGELAEEAAGRSAPATPQLRSSAKGRLIGQPLTRLDGPAKCDGSVRFSADVRLPGMLFAAVRMAPPGGHLRDVTRDAIKGAPGVRQIVSRDGWVAVVADNWWAAERALKAADPVFSGANSPADMRPLFEEALDKGDADQWFSRGDYDGAVRGSRPLAATYYAAPSQHLGLEPVSATARPTSSGVEAWTASQAPGFGKSGENLSLYPMAIGEPAGRAMEPDALPIAVELARELKAPVQATLSQSVGQNHDRIAPGALARMTALPGANGLTEAWQMRVAAMDGLALAFARLEGRDVSQKLGSTGLDGVVPPYAIANVRIESVAASAPMTAGYMRGSPQREMCFFIESFIDELARAAGIEPLAFRMSMLGSDPRLARCLQGAARLAQWDGGARGSSMGIAGCSAFGSHIGLVADASIGDDQRVKVHRLVAAVDCGRVVNPGIVEQQIQGGLIWALAQATVPAPEWVAGMPRARPIGGIGLPRIGELSQIVVEIIPSSDAPGGISGLGTTAVAPAVANAIFAATGKRMRSLPFEPMAVA